MTDKKTAPRATAETMAAKQRDISVSEFFAKNRHLLGFDNPRKALLTAVKEAVDNSLDACEEAGILPHIVVVIEDLDDAKSPKAPGGDVEAAGGKKPKVAQSSRYRVTVVDNGPGIVRKQVENVFGRLLFGSKFHRLKMSRGQQGIGISAAGMYGLITTGKPMLIQTRPKAGQPAHHIELAMNTKTNRAEVTADEETDDFPLARLRGLSVGTRRLAESGEFLNPEEFPTGTSVTIELEGRYQKGRGSVDEFLELTAIANPHAQVVFVPPTRVSAEEEDTLVDAAKRGKGKDADRSPPGVDGTSSSAPGDAAAAAGPGGFIDAKTQERDGVILYPRGVRELPPETKEIQPHPKGIELGTLLQMLKDYEAAEKGGTLNHFLQERFSRISPSTASGFCEKIGVTSRTKASDIEPPQVELLYKEFQEAKLAPPPTDCLAPIGVRQLLAGMLKGVRAEFYAASSREPAIYRGRPFQIEAAIAFGGELPADDSARVIRFANRVPLLFQQSACSSFKSVIETNWRNYDLQQPRGSIPVGPLVIMIHMASVWVPFTSESKEAIADYDEIRKEMKLALMECGRKLGTYLRKRAKMRREGERRDVFQKYIGEITKAVNAINGTDPAKLYEVLLEQARKRTAIADAQLDDEGRQVKEDPADQDGVIVIEDQAPKTPDLAGVSNQAPPNQPSGARTGGQSSPGSGDASKKRSGKELSTRPGGGSSRSSSREGVSKPRDGDIFSQSNAEAAMLKVAGMDEDSAAPSRSKRGGSAPAVEAKPSGGKSNSGKPAAASKGVAEKPAADKSAGKTKPKMRLVNGRLVPVEEGPGLF